MLRPIMTACAGVLLLALSCGDDDAKKVVAPEAGAGGDGSEAGGPPGPDQGGSMSGAGMPSIPVEGGAAGQMGVAGMSAQAGGGGEGPEPKVLDVGANRGGGGVQGYHTCVVLTSGAAYCAGANYYGELGNPATSGIAINSSLLPVSGPGGVGVFANAERVALGEGFSCAKQSDGSVWCWGANFFGTVGNGTDGSIAQADSPVQVLDADSDLGAGGAGPGPLQGITALASGTHHTCALGADQYLRCWGDNSSGQLGLGIPDGILNMASRVDLPNVAEVGTGYRHTCARTSGDTAALQTVYCWGSGTLLGQDADVTDKSTPVQVLDDAGTGFINDIVSLAVGGLHSCAAKSDGTVLCWGVNDQGQCGTGGFDALDAPLALPAQVVLAGNGAPLDGVVALFAGDATSCAVTTDSDVWCWGGNDEGQLGINSLDHQPNPVQLVGLKAGKLSLGSDTSCAIDPAYQSVWCWGGNSSGQLGTANTDPSLVPQLLPLP